MAKSIYTGEYQVAVRCLYDLRVSAELSQLQLAEILGRPQSFVSNGESGYRRLDIYQLYQWITACGSTMARFGGMVDRRIAAMSPREKGIKAREGTRKVGRKR